MIQLRLEQSDNVITAINKIKNISDLNIELIIPKRSVLFEDALNLKLIQQQADKLEKSIEFVTDDEIGNKLIESLMGKIPEAYIPEEPEEAKPAIQPAVKEGGRKIAFPRISLNFLRLLPKGKGGFIAVVIVLILLISFIFYGSKAPKATAKISVRSQPLTKSVTIRVKADGLTDIKNKTLRGTLLSTTVEDTMEKDTTGTKTVGEKAEGKVTIYNKTSSEVKLNKGDKLTYKGKSTDLNYYLKGDVTVPPNASQDPLDDASPIIPGEATQDIVAADIGESYNIDDGKSLTVSGYKSGDLAAKTKTKISGGKSEQVKTVTLDDRANLLKDLQVQAVLKAEADIKTKLGSTQRLISGATSTKIAKQTYSKNVNDEAQKISLTLSVNAESLVYLNSELNSFLDEYVKDVIPESFVLSEQDREVEVEVLGNSTNSVLTSKEADLQVTLKTYIMPNIKEEELKNSLKGKSVTEAIKILESIKNVTYYEFKLSPVIPLFRNVPKDPNRIQITIVKE